MIHLANAGVDVLRLDAVAFTWKRLGTNCQNQPEAHLIAQVYRALMAIAAPAVLLKAEAIVAPGDLLPYLGVHRLERAECHLAYHNQLMVMLWSSLAVGRRRARRRGDAGAAPDAGVRRVGELRALPRRHRVGGQRRRRRGGRVSTAPRTASSWPGSTAATSGSRSPTACRSPATPTSATSARAAPPRRCAASAARCAPATHAAIDAAMRRLQLLYGVMFGFPGVPLVYMGDELALDNDPSYVVDPAKEDDSRWVHRPEMSWAKAERRHVDGDQRAPHVRVRPRPRCRTCRTPGDERRRRRDHPASRGHGGLRLDPAPPAPRPVLRPRQLRRPPGHGADRRVRRRPGWSARA